MPRAWAGVAVLFASCPSGINAYLFAERYGEGVALASSAVALSTALALGTSLLWLRCSASAEAFFGEGNPVAVRTCDTARNRTASKAAPGPAPVAWARPPFDVLRRRPVPLLADFTGRARAAV